MLKKTTLFGLNTMNQKEMNSNCVQRPTFWVSAGQVIICNDSYTPPKTNMSPENQWLEDVFPIQIVPCKRTC